MKVNRRRPILHITTC